MANPLTFAAAGLTALTSGFSAASTLTAGEAAAAGGRLAAQGGQATQAGYNYAAQVAQAQAQSSANAKEFEARQLEMQANEARATAQRGAFEARRNANLAQSTLQARAAASGGGASDVNVVNLAGDIGARGEYQALLDMFQGENRARGLEDTAAGARMTGAAELAGGEQKAQGLRMRGDLAAYEGAVANWESEAKKRASRLSAIGTLIGGASSAAGMYQGKVPFGKSSYG